MREHHRILNVVPESSEGEPTLSKQLESAHDELDVPEEERRIASRTLSIVKGKDLASYEHSLQVGLTARKIARELGADERTALLAGELHDNGKMFVPEALLKKTAAWTEEDKVAMRKHDVHGADMLRGGPLDRLAPVVLMHHGRGPDDLPAWYAELPDTVRAQAEADAKIVSIADVYEALHRDNGRFDHPLNGAEIRAEMDKAFPDDGELIERLYTARVFSEDAGMLAEAA